jgi:pimeloyl-ACP methyl ester carboxylesterase
MKEMGQPVKQHWRWVFRLGLLAVGVYVAVLAVLLCLEDRLLYRPALASRVWFEPLAELHIEDLSLTASDGTVISAWFMAPPGWRPEAGAVLLSHGTNGNVSTWQKLAARWQREIHRAVLVYDYPGYGRSGGRPTEAGCYAAAEAAFTWLTQRKNVPARQVMLVGSSLGSAMATELAARHDNRLLVLVGAFTSFPDMAQEKVPCYPARYLVHSRLDNLARIDRVRGPIFIAHGTDDHLVPFWMGERLFEKARQPKRFFPLPDHKHRHPTRPAFFRAVRHYLAETEGSFPDRRSVLFAP